MRYTIEVGWPSPHPTVRAEVTEFWAAEEILSPAMRDARASQLLVIARDDKQAIVANSSAVRMTMQNLGFPCFYYRSYVSVSHRAIGVRGSHLARQMLETSFRVLNERFLSGFDPDALGMFLEVESESVKRHYRETVWRVAEFRFVYIGNTPEGNHCRLAYFDSSALPGVPAAQT